MSDELNNLKSRLQEVTEAIAPLVKMQGDLKAQIRRVEARNWLQDNWVTMDQVALSSGDDRPWFGDVWSFAKWIKANEAEKRFAEWNTMIYFASDLIAGRMPEAKAYLSDLEELTKERSAK